MSEGVVHEITTQKALPDFRVLQSVDLSSQESAIKERFNGSLEKFIREDKRHPHPASIQNGKQFKDYLSVVASSIARTSYVLGLDEDINISFFGDSNNVARGGNKTIEFNIDDIYESCAQLKSDKDEATKVIRQNIAEENYHNWQSLHDQEKYKRTQEVARNLMNNPNDPDSLIAYLSDPGEIEAKQFGISFAHYEDSGE